MNGDAAGPELHGEVSPKATGGVIRYRTWPARRHPAWLVLALLGVGGGTALVSLALDSVYWGVMAFVGLSLLAAAFFFPTLVSLDGPTLVVRQLGTPRSFDLREFRRVEVASDQLPRVELVRSQGLQLAPMGGLMLPLPEARTSREQVLAHLRRWIGRRQTGRFVIDIDHAPEDELEANE